MARKRRHFSQQEKEGYISAWQAAGKPPPSRWANEQDLTPSNFITWLQQRGLYKRTRGKPNGAQAPDPQRVRKALDLAYGGGLNRPSVGATAVGVSPQTVANWRAQYPELMPGRVQVVDRDAPQVTHFDAAAERAARQGDAGANGRGQPLRLGSGGPAPYQGAAQGNLELGDDQGSAMFEQAQEDKWEELMRLLAPLPIRARLRVLQLVDSLGG